MKKSFVYIFISVVIISLLSGCNVNVTDTSDFDIENNLADDQKYELGELIFYEKEDISYAEGFDIWYDENGYKLIEVYDSAGYLLIPEGEEEPENIPDDVVVLKKPVNNIYLAASAAMALFVKIGALDDIAFSGTDADGWYIDEAKEAMKSGDIVFAGKYSQPDYELLVDEGCSLAIESTMILHTPEVKEKLEILGIPVFVDQSSYEAHPLGKAEWIKLYGVLTGKEDEAETYFNEEKEKALELSVEETEEKSVAFFYVTSGGQINVRKSGDYIPKMIEMAGGSYVLSDVAGDENALSTMNMDAETFFSQARDADIIIYNSTVTGELESIDDLIAKSPIFEEFKAVKSKNVWCMSASTFQQTTAIAEMILDFNRVISGSDDETTFLTRLY